MSQRWALTVAVILLASSGCQSNPVASHTHSKTPQKVERLPQWDWACGIPKSVQRGDLVPVTLEPAEVASLMPAVEQPDIQLASATNEPARFKVVKVGEKNIQNFEQMHGAVERANRSQIKEAVDVAILPPGADNNAEVTNVHLTPAALLAVEQAVAKKHRAVRVTEDGNPWVLLCEGDTRCEVMARVERSKGLMQVVMAHAVLGGSPKQLPKEVLASCDGTLLRCLTVAEALELLYDPKPRAELTNLENNAANAGHFSFAATSAAEDYLVPTNFKKLQEQTKRASGLPALAVVPGAFYPGSPLLGDARALAGFLLQKQLCSPGEPEKLGWLAFAGESLTRGGTVEIEVDLGGSPKKIRFLVPKP